MDRRDFLEISPFQADEGELIGKDPSDMPSEILSLKFRAQKSTEGHSSEVSRLLLWERGGGSQVRGGRLCTLAISHANEPLPQEIQTFSRSETRKSQALAASLVHETW